MRSRRRWLTGGGIVLVMAAIAIGATVSWHFSSAVLVPDHTSWAKGTEVEGLPPGHIVLARNEESERPGAYGLEWPGGHAVIGAVVAVDADTVTRRLRDVRGYLVPDMDVASKLTSTPAIRGRRWGFPSLTSTFPTNSGRCRLGSSPGKAAPGRSSCTGSTAPRSWPCA